MSEPCSKLLKEWAIVCRALGDGRQVFLARKGGISEEEGEFVVENKEFFLFPTYAHQNKEALKPQFHQELDLVGRTEPQDQRVHLSLFARVTHTLKVTNASVLSQLEDKHIWTERLLKDRFEWGLEKGIHLLVLRVYRLPEEIRVPLKPKYMGCKSWVTIDEPLPIPTGLQPALSDLEFSLKRQQILERLQ